MRMMAMTEGTGLRIVGLGASIANYKDIASWLGVNENKAIFNFEPSQRDVPVEISLVSFDQNDKGLRVLQMIKPAYT